ncbi:MAG: tRNA (adenosine(37)-N6)-threonylcarbamoyltransferase complex ATPase subunit type 1 TsaE [Parcubacteria group bacterium]|jgi:tRNA threonylcarbamoyladenosine biosynthesis protein TsaE
MNSDQRTRNNKDAFVTNNAKQTQKLGEMLAKELRGGEILCLSGELGSGKTTFSQGILKGLGVKGPFTSPTFVVLKHYGIRNYELGIMNVYHIDVYRVGPKDILELGWEEIIAGKNNVVIVEWAERIKRIIPKSAIWLKFSHFDKNNRKIAVNSKFKSQNAK